MFELITAILTALQGEQGDSLTETGVVWLGSR